MPLRNSLIAGSVAFVAAGLSPSGAAAQEPVFYRFEEAGRTSKVALYVAEVGETETRVIAVRSDQDVAYWDVTLSHDCETPGRYWERGQLKRWDGLRERELAPWTFSDYLTSQLGIPRGVFHRMMNCDSQHIWGERIDGLNAALRDAAEWSLQN